MNKFIFLTAFLTLPVSADEWRGPLPLENERPLQAIFLHLPQQSPDVLPPGKTRLSAQFDIANNLLIPAPGPNGEAVIEDFETQRLKIAWQRGWKRGWEYGAGANITARNGGLLDGPIELYHNLLGLEGNAIDNPTGRKNLPRGRSILRFTDANGIGINKGSAFGLGDTTVWLKKQLSRGKFASASRLSVKVPTGSGSKVLGSGGFDAGFALDARYQFARRWAIFGSAGAAKYGSADVPNAKGSGWQAGLGFEWRVGRRESVIAQTDAASRVVTTGNPFADRTPVIGSIGFKKQINERSSYWVALAENGDFHRYNAPFFGNIGPDTAISFGYEIKR